MILGLKERKVVGEMPDEHFLELDRHGRTLVHLHGEHAVEHPPLLVEVNQIGGRMPVDPVTVAVPLHKDSVLVPLVRCEFLDLEPTDDPTLSLRIDHHFFPGMGENPSAFFLVEHSVVLRFSGHYVALVTGQGIQPQLGR